MKIKLEINRIPRPIPVPIAASVAALNPVLELPIPAGETDIDVILLVLLVCEVDVDVNVLAFAVNVDGLLLEVSCAKTQPLIWMPAAVDSCVSVSVDVVQPAFAWTPYVITWPGDSWLMHSPVSPTSKVL